MNRSLSDYEGEYGRVMFQLKSLNATAQWLEEKIGEIRQQQQAEMFKQANQKPANQPQEGDKK